MFEAASKASDRPLLKIKLGGEGDVERLQAGSQWCAEINADH